MFVYTKSKTFCIFAVVAGEVGKLAEQSRGTAETIKGLTGQVTGSVQAYVPPL